MTSGAWFGSMIPPAPTRIVDVPPAMWPMTTAVAALAIPGMLWCSATQYRRYPSASARRARSRELRIESAGLPPSVMGERSRTESAVTGETGCMVEDCGSA